MQQKNPSHLLGLYIHWPYCLSKCPYCDFASSVCKNIDEEALFWGYKRDLQQFKTDRPITSIFFGGGTPSLMSLPFLEKIIAEIRKNYSLASDIEISMEANPDAISLVKMRQFYELGINRLSIGVQALNDKDLAFLGRKHSLVRALECIDEAKSVFHNINMDLIYARQKQSVTAWEKELTKALSLNLPHYSLYQLTIEENTIFYKQHQKVATDIQAQKLYIETDKIMTNKGLPAYEVSNYAKPGFECRHNLTYWLGADYIGIGPAAHGRLGLIATENPRSVQAWLHQGTTSETLTKDQRYMEKLLMGLRLRNHDFPTQDIPQHKLQEALNKGWIIQNKQGIRPTLQGTIVLNQLTLLLLN
ncbi:MAG: radical SAM family heme chaperone HemW [Alphaproteobacteria bacterium]|nr:radical SAM family heme chaperone HemW [Alphaproteobacteria bacterium]